MCFGRRQGSQFLGLIGGEVTWRAWPIAELGAWSSLTARLYPCESVVPQPPPCPERRRREKSGFPEPESRFPGFNTIMFLINRYMGGGGGGGGGGFGGGFGGGGGGMFGSIINSIGEAAANYQPDPPPPRTHPSVTQSSESDEDRQFRRIFNQLAGEDMEVSATELMGILNKIIAKHADLKTDGFSSDSCRSMVAVMDSDSTGKLGFEEFKYLWNNIKKWQAVYKRYDVDRSGTIGSTELPNSFQAAGFQLNGELYQMIVRRYSDEKGEMDFDNFICCLVRLDAMFRAFKALDKDGDGRIKVSIQEWLQLTMYS